MFRLVQLGMLFLAMSWTSHAQEVRASISGVITDQSGSPVPGAVISARSATTGAVVTTESNESGLYLTPFLTPGSYSLAVEKEGFRRSQRENIVLQTLDKARVDVQLQVGAVADSVTVTDTVSALQTETASRSQIISNELIANIPTQGRNPFQIAWSAPGVIKTGGWRYLRSFDIAGTSNFSVNGGRNRENEVLMDGISNVRANRTVIHVPTMDSVQEFKILTNTYDAQYGRTGGGIVTIVSKSGGNQFHGTLYEYFQNSKLNANQTELNAGGIRKPPNNINDYGFEVDGPVLIPGVFNGKNRLFWLLSYEAMRQRSADPAVATVPELAWRTGDFSTLFNAQGRQVSIYDPLTTLADGTRTPFAGNQLPASRISRIAAEAFKFYPAPTSAGVGPAKTLNYPYPSRWVGDMDQWTGRVDFHINPRNITYFRYGQNPFSEYRGLKFIQNVSDSNPAEPTGNAPLIRNGRNWAFNWTSTLSPTMTFDLRAGLSRWEETTGSSYGTGFDQGQLGIDPALTRQFTRVGFPQISLGTYQSMGADRLISYGANDVYTVQPNFNMVRGKHFFKFGVEARRYNDNTLNPGLAVGSYTFGRNWTQAQSNQADATSGNEVATFLLGYPTSAFVDRNIDPAFSHYFYAGFFQDDWKINQRLTVNVGIRWDYESPNIERYDRMVNGLDFSAPSPIANRVQGLSLKGAVQFANVGGMPRGAFTPDKNNWAPRIGVAYRMNDKWVLRGGYGLYYFGDDLAGGNQGYSQRTNAVVTVDSLRPAVNMTNAFALQPGGQLLAAVGNAEGAASFLGQGLSIPYRDRAIALSHQYSFDIQRELPGNMLVEAGYVGNLTRKLPVSAAANFIPTSELERNSGTAATAYYNTQVPNPMAGLIPLNAALNRATVTRQTLLTAFPQFTGVTFTGLPIGQQRYDSFQLKLTKRFASGLTFLSSYTIGKTLEQVSLLNNQNFNLSNPDSTPLIKQPADQIDVPQKFNIVAVYDLPFGKGRSIAGGVSRGVDMIIGGWSLNANVTYQSGWAINYPNAAQVSPGSAKLDNPTVGQWFDTSLWINPSTGRLVTAQQPFTLRNFPLRFSDVRVPGYQNWDASISKYFPIHERVRLQFRFEMVNAFNHPWYTGIASVDVTNAQFGRLNPAQGNLPRFLKLGLQLTW